MHRLLLLALGPALLLACQHDPLSAGGDAPADAALLADASVDAPAPRDLASLDLASLDLAARPDGADRCAAFDECTCLTLSSCRAVVEGCYCPPESCGQAQCACGGGRYFGCANPGCAGTLSCSRAARVARDFNGCPACDEPLDCTDGIARLKASCAIDDGLLSAFTCGGDAACKLACIRNVHQCEQVGCGLCAVCICGKFGDFERCVMRCEGGT